MAGKTGLARLARAAGVDVVPVGLWGTHRVIPAKGRKAERFRTPIAVVVGRPSRSGRAPTPVRRPIASWPASATPWPGPGGSTPSRRRPSRDAWWVRSPESARLRSCRGRMAQAQLDAEFDARARRRPELMRLAVIGAGSWGTTVAALGLRNADHVSLWARRPELAETIAATGENPDYLPGRALGAVAATARLDEASTAPTWSPSPSRRTASGRCSDAAAQFVPPGALVLSLAKGLEQGSLKRMTEVAAEVLPGHGDGRIGVLTGPNIATEVAAGLPTASVVAVGDPAAAAAAQRLFMTDTFRVYTNPDVVGCEIAGVVKNVVALAAGIAQGLGVGDNARAALITRGLAELTRFGLALGGNPLSFLGLAGIGDIVVTCTSPRSRNRSVGEALGRGRPLADVLGEMTMVAEGVRSTRAVLDRAAAAGVEMPIAEEVQAVLDGARTPAAAVRRSCCGRRSRSWTASASPAEAAGMIWVMRRRRVRAIRGITVVVVLVAALVLPAAPAPADSPIHPENRPSGLAGETNGRVRPEALVGVEGDCRAGRAAGPSLALLFAAARADGVALRPGDCYRPADQQSAAKSNACGKGNCACAGGDGHVDARLGRGGGLPRRGGER